MGVHIVFLNGDKREDAAATFLREQGYTVSMARESYKELIELANQADIVVFPVQGLEKSIYKDIDYSRFLSLLTARQLVLLGLGSPAISGGLRERGIKHICYLNRNDFALLNALPTAEGAIAMALLACDEILTGKKTLVLGFGRVGQVLALKLKAFGALTYVSSRVGDELALALAHGLQTIPLSQLPGFLKEFKIIFNTIPALILGPKELAQIQRGAYILDLASAPGGVDHEAARQYGIKVESAPGLPGKIAPVSAGIILGQTIKQIIQEEGL